MVRKSALLALSALLGGLALPVVAQTTGGDWRPFRVGHTYYYAAGAGQDSIVTVRIKAGEMAGADSAWSFQQVARGRGQNRPPVLLPDTELGATQTALLGGDFELRTSAARMFRLRTHLPIGATWPFGSGLTATLSARTWEPVALADSSVRDSMLVIGLSNGQTIRLSKRYGLVSAPSLLALSAGQSAPMLTLYALPERNAGLPPNHPWRLFNFSPGDELGYHYTVGGINFTWGVVCKESWLRVRVLDRRFDATGDTLLYTLLSQRHDASAAGPNNPFCPNGSNYAITLPAETSILRIPRHGFEWRSGIVGMFASGSATVGSHQFFDAGGFPAHVNEGTRRMEPVAGCGGRFASHISQWHYDSAQQVFTPMVDYAGHLLVAEGLGVVEDNYSNFAEYATKLVWYQKNGDQCGSLTGFPVLLATPAPLSAEHVQLYPNPATTTARLNLTGTRGGALTLTATDALGRRVWQHTQVVGAEADIALPVGGWAPGVYYVRVALPEGARVLRVVKE